MFKIDGLTYKFGKKAAVKSDNDRLIRFIFAFHKLQNTRSYKTDI